MLARVLSAVGRTFIGTGVLLLLFVAYQLWGTGLHEARAQEDLAAEFGDRLARVADVTATSTGAPSTTAPTTTVVTPTSGAAPTTTVDDGEATDPDRAEPIEVKAGEALARIRIPKIGVDKVVVEGVTVDDLRKGPGHYRSTPQPGHPGNSAIAGHRTTYGAPFGDIDKLVPGDLITVETLHGTWTYEVLPAPDDPASGHFIVAPEDVWVLDDVGDNRLTLTACHPKYSAAQRIIVSARLRETPATPPPTTAPPIEDELAADAGDDGEATAAPDTPAAADLDEGLGGDPSARTPALLWGLVFLLALAGVWQLSVRWRRWPAYAVGALPMVVVVFSWFEQLDRWMPAR